MRRKQIVLKNKKYAFSVVCLFCAAIMILAGCTEGGRDFFETEGSGRDTEAFNNYEIDESHTSDVEQESNYVNIMFAPSGGYTADSSELDAAMSVLEKRLDAFGVERYELESDYPLGQIRLRCVSDGMTDNFEELSAKLCERAELTFREGALFDIGGQLIGNYEELPVVLDGRDVKQAFAFYDPVQNEYSVKLEFTDSGTEKFSQATERLCKTHGIISIYMDDKELCRPSVSEHITDGVAVITGGFNAESAKELADKINTGALPFDMEALKVDTDIK